MAAEAAIDLVIRFSTSNPDIVLTIERPSTTSALFVKQQIRSHLEAPASGGKLRLIHAGKVVPDGQALSQSLHVVIPPRDDETGKSEKAKGKQPVRDTEKITPAARVYIHCSIGDALSASELVSEAKAAQEADAALESSIKTHAATIQAGPGNASTTTPAPRGFDRLINAGFTQSEVATLRTQFLAIQAHTHTPDTMPSGEELLALEESWLDNTTNPGTAGAEDTGGFGSEDAGGLEDMLWGNLMGFFWPIGAMFWLMREEGVWSRRRQTAVLSGFILNVVFGMFKILV